MKKIYDTNESHYLGTDPAKPGSKVTGGCIVSWNGQTFKATNINISFDNDHQAQPRHHLKPLDWTATTHASGSLVMVPDRTKPLSRKQRLRRRELARRQTPQQLLILKTLEEQAIDLVVTKGAQQERQFALNASLNRVTRLGTLDLTAAKWPASRKHWERLFLGEWISDAWIKPGVVCRYQDQAAQVMETIDESHPHRDLRVKIRFVNKRTGKLADKWVSRGALTQA